MNNTRRKQIQAIHDTLMDCYSKLEELAQEEREAFDNLPENLQSGSKGEAIEAAADQLEDAMSSINLATDALDEIQ